MRSRERAEAVVAERDRELAALQARLDDLVGERDALSAKLDEAETGLSGFKEQTVVVHQPGGSQSLRGVLLHVYRDCIVLAHATTVDASAEAVGGEPVIPRAPGMWWQANAPEPKA